MRKILVVFGTRPEAIKMAPLVLKLKSAGTAFETKVCITAQHREMLDQVLTIFDIVPDFDLNLMKPGQDLFDLSARILQAMRDVLQNYNPDVVLVHGDTTTSTMVALAAYYCRIPVGHVEAGLRTHNIYSPFPEEMNRQLTGRLTTFHFAPTLMAKENLLREGISEPDIIVTGNTVIDALHIALAKLMDNDSLRKNIIAGLKNNGLEGLDEILDNKRKLVLVTGHRRENFGTGFENICIALKKFAIDFPNFLIVYPVHLNPNVQKPVFDILSNVDNIKLIAPLEYLSFLFLMEQSYMILTDSGGIQEEAPGLGKPVLVMRDTTERPEAVEAGTVKLVGTNADSIYSNLKELATSANSYQKMSNAVNPYGDGLASGRIVDFLNQIKFEN